MKPLKEALFSRKKLNSGNGPELILANMKSNYQDFLYVKFMNGVFRFIYEFKDLIYKDRYITEDVFLSIESAKDLLKFLERGQSIDFDFVEGVHEDTGISTQKSIDSISVIDNDVSNREDTGFSFLNNKDNKKQLIKYIKEYIK